MYVVLTNNLRWIVSSFTWVGILRRKLTESSSHSLRFRVCRSNEQCTQNHFIPFTWVGILTEKTYKSSSHSLRLRGCRSNEQSTLNRFILQSVTTNLAMFSVWIGEHLCFLNYRFETSTVLMMLQLPILFLILLGLCLTNEPNEMISLCTDFQSLHGYSRIFLFISVW